MMKIESLTLENYILNPLGLEIALDIFSPKICKKFLRLTSKLSDVYFIKRALISSLIRQLIKEDKFKPFKFMVKRDFKPEAFMHDEGYISISYGIFRSCSALPFMSVFVHELSHVYLSQQDFYKDLKKVNKEFNDKYREVDLGVKNAVVSPVEFYAYLVSKSIFERLKSEAKKDKTKIALDAVIRDLDGKVAKIRGAIKKIVENFI